jgi:type II secretory pathway pseudopilin PulG
MRMRSKQSGLTLPELAVVIATIALLVGFALPAVRALLNSFETQSGATALISTALSSARAIAAREHRYAGVRFQRDLSGSQYMIFIVQDPKIMAYGFRAVEGVKPIKLPDSVSVMDLTIVPNRNVSNPVNPLQPEIRIDDPSLLLTDAERDTWIDEPKELSDITTFSIIFSPGGKLVIHGIRVRNKDGFVDSPSNTNISYDDVFNKKVQVDQKYNGFDRNAVPPGAGQFYQDDYFDSTWPDLSLGPEPSRNSFVIVYERDKFEQALANGRAWSDYLKQVTPKRIYINSYTGTMILPD